MAISDRYEGLELVQSSPTGDTYSARHITLGRPVMIRTIAVSRIDESEVERIRTAILRTAKLVHPNILSVIDAELGDDPYFVTDPFVDSLRSRLDAGPVDSSTAARWGLQLLRAISHAHAHDVIHRGLSPLRVHFDQTDGVRLADFGLSTVMQDKKSGTTAIEAHAAPYLPVGVLRDPSSYSERADRYGIAALIVQAITGTVPEGAQLDTSTARGRVPTEVTTGLSRLLSGSATAADVETLTSAFKRWVDSTDAPDSGASRPVPASAPPAQAAPQGATKSTTSSAADEADASPDLAKGGAVSSKTRRPSSPKGTSRAETEANPDAAPVSGVGESAPAETADDAAPTAAAAVDPPPAPSSQPTGSAPGSDEASRAKDKLNKYAALFSD